MEQHYTPAQYFCMTLFFGACLYIVYGFYLLQNDRYEAKKKEKNKWKNYFKKEDK